MSPGVTIIETLVGTGGETAATSEDERQEPWQLVTLSSTVLRSAAALAWTELLVLDKAGDGLSAAMS